MIFGTILVLIAVPAWRLLYGRVILKAMGSQRVLFLGTSQVSQEIAAHLLERPELGMLPLGFVDDVAGGQFPFGELLGRIKDLTDVARSLKPDLVVVGMTERRRELPMSEMLHLRFSGVQFEDAAVTFEATFGRIYQSATAALPPDFSGRPGSAQRKPLLALHLFLPAPR